METLKSRTEIPANVMLRDDWSPICECHSQPDPHLESIIESSHGDPSRLLWLWRLAAKIQKIDGVNLVPYRVMQLTGLPVRQVYVCGSEVYRIERDGRVTTRLV